MEPIYPNSYDNCTEMEDTFEQRFSTRSLRMLKIITPFLPLSIQPGLAMMIRMQELAHTLNYLRSLTPGNLVLASEKQKSNPAPQSMAELLQPDTLNRIFQRLSPLLRPNERNELAKIKQLLNMLETYKQLEPLMSMFTEMASSTGSPAPSTDNTTKDTDVSATDAGVAASTPAFLSGFSPEMLMGILDPDMLQNAGALMQMFASVPNISAASDSSHTTDTDTRIES